MIFKSRADRLFKKYGYEKAYEDDYLMYKKKLEHGETFRIIFLDNAHRVDFDIVYKGMVYNAIAKVDAQAIKLAYIKCKELRWC